MSLKMRILALLYLGLGLLGATFSMVSAVLEEGEEPATLRRVVRQSPLLAEDQWRTDLRCGPSYPLPDGSPAHCNPWSDFACCSDKGWCGNSWYHCSCKGCTHSKIESSNKVLLNSDHEVTIKFFSNPQPTVLVWSYGTNFQEMPNLIQIPSDNGKFSTSLRDLKNGNYQVRLKIAGVTEEDLETRFKLHVANEIGETYYKVILSRIPHPPSGLQVTDTMPTSLNLMWSYDGNSDDISYYVLLYRLKNTRSDYAEISGIKTKFSTVRDLESGKRYEFQVLAVNKVGHGTISEPFIYTTTAPRCGGEYNTDSGMIQHKWGTKCTWIIRTAGPMKITYKSKDHSHTCCEYLTIRDGSIKFSPMIGKFDVGDEYQPIQTSTNTAHLFYEKVHDRIRTTGFELHWEPLALPGPTLSVSNIMPTSVQITWTHNTVNPADISYYVIQYKHRNAEQQYKEISGILQTNSYTVRGLTPSTAYEFHVLTQNRNGRGSPSDPSYVNTTDSGCGAEYNSSRGMINFDYPRPDTIWTVKKYCTWIIRAEEAIKITLISLKTEVKDYLTIRDGESIESNILGKFFGSNVLRSVKTSTHAAHLVFRSPYQGGTVFDLYWEPAVETFYQISLNSDQEVRFKFSMNPQPTDLTWYYGPNFQEMPNVIQIPSDNGKFATSLIDLENGNYAALLRIVGITEEDIGTKFKLHVVNENGEYFYRVQLSAFPPPPSIQISDIMPTAVLITWNYNINQGDIPHYVIQYKPKNTQQDYTEISDIVTKFYTVRGLMPSTYYEFLVRAVHKIGRGPPSELSYVTTNKTGCGGEYFSSSGILRHPLNGGNYNRSEYCTWIIRAEDRIKITFVSVLFDHTDYLTIRDGESTESDMLGKFNVNKYSDIKVVEPVQTTTAAAHLLFTSYEYSDGNEGFEIHWEPLVETSYQAILHSNHEIRLNFPISSQPTSLHWSYGANFEEMPNLIQIPSDNGKFSTSLIDLENGNYQALLIITGVTEEDLATMFKLHVTNELGITHYRVILSAFPSQSPSLEFSDVLPNSVQIMWDYNVKPEDISYYVIQYKPKDVDQDYKEISGIETKSYNVRGLTPSMEYEFHVLPMHKNGRGPRSESENVTTHKTVINPRTPLNLKSSTIMPTSVKLMWNYINPGDISYYVIQYKLRDTDQDYTEISNIATNSYTVKGLVPSKYYHFRVLAVDQIGRGPPTETLRVNTRWTGCGDEYNSSTGMIRHPLTGNYYNNENCIWIIRADEHMKFTLVRIDTEENKDYLYIRDSESLESKMVHSFTGEIAMRSVQTSTNAANVIFTSDKSRRSSGFDLLWEPLVQTFYEIPINSDYEIKLKFYANPQPTALEWSYGANFQEMPNLLQVPSDNGKFSTSLIDLGNGNYQAVLKIAGITEEDFQTRFKLHVANEIGETSYRVILSAFPHPPSSLQFSDIKPNSLQITWDYNGNPEDISYYVIQYKPRNTDQDYAEISDIVTKFYTVTGLMASTDYEFRILAVHKTGRGPTSESSYVITRCGGEYNSNSGIIRHPLSGRSYLGNGNCIWIIRAENCINITFGSFSSNTRLFIRDGSDGESIDSNLLGWFVGENVNISSVQTGTHAAYLFIESDGSIDKNKFELTWEPTTVSCPPRLLISNIMPTSVKITWNYNINPDDISYYVIKYKLMDRWSSDTDYTEISDIKTNTYTVTGLTPSGDTRREWDAKKYEFQVRAVYKNGDELTSLPSYVTTRRPGCGGEYNSRNGTIQYPIDGGDWMLIDRYENNDTCKWIIRAEDHPINIVFFQFRTEKGSDYLYIRDGESNESNLLGRFTGSTIPSLIRTNASVVYLHFTSDSLVTDDGFELYWSS